MTSLFEFLAGFFFCLLGLGYIFKPDLVGHIYSIIKNVFLNETYLMLERKKWGVFFLLLGFFFLYLALMPSK